MGRRRRRGGKSKGESGGLQLAHVLLMLRVKLFASISDPATAAASAAAAAAAAAVAVWTPSPAAFLDKSSCISQSKRILLSS